MNRKRTTQKKVIMIELSKSCVKDFKATGDKDALLFPYYDTSDPRYFDKKTKKRAQRMRF
ncbi:hypothetical protein BMR02_14540 [Methylococcaceae bacterium HT1]|nr:hypothetical protein BMR02_14540 [Methylococcaceae bacterium HT1]TXL11276.1 hypothetical protein BMR05_16145 [Methylococcaceae bacterium HT4]TXL14403.1 hypothetical protein BMR04_13360 [Methylococcaceae bacterium HT3]TXL14409.1 hypothetical protein BMR06_16420 [Methylococcaceae bacterium HT5]TXL19354.1 hypothetical protein BMR03_15310 [Methylococcaceae bacterium HT2]